MSEAKIDQHESYGLISASRCTGHVPLFGSSVDTGSFVIVRISKAEVKRDLSSDWYHDLDEIIEVRMSCNQFAEFITHMNSGNGTPCTIQHIERKKMAPPTAVDKRGQIENEFKDRVTRVFDKTRGIAREAERLLAGDLKTKGSRQELAELLRVLIQETTSNIPFVQSMFNESIDKTITEAKTEVESFVEGKIRSLGMEALDSEIKQLLSAPARSKVLNIEEKRDQSGS